MLNLFQHLSVSVSLRFPELDSGFRMTVFGFSFSRNRNYLVSVYKLQSFVIPASEASRESFLKTDSGQAGMAEKRQLFDFIHRH